MLLRLFLTRELVLCVCHPRTPRARFPCSPSSLCRESPSPLPSGGEEGSVLYTGNIRRVLVCFNAKALGNEWTRLPVLDLPLLRFRHNSAICQAVFRSAFTIFVMWSLQNLSAYKDDVVIIESHLVWYCRRASKDQIFLSVYLEAMLKPVCRCISRRLFKLDVKIHGE